MAGLPMDFHHSPRLLTHTSSAIALFVALLFGAVAGAQQSSSQSPSGLGRPLSKAELQAWDISIRPDGAELPSGSGNATQGALAFTLRGCSDCHGPTAKEGPAPVLVTTDAQPRGGIRRWPFAPTIWDFIHRAMPYDRPGRLTADEVYSLVAFLLFRNGIIQEDDVMDAKSLPRVQMPYRADYTPPPEWTPSTPRRFKILP